MPPLHIANSGIFTEKEEMHISYNPEYHPIPLLTTEPGSLQESSPGVGGRSCLGIRFWCTFGQDALQICVACVQRCTLSQGPPLAQNPRVGEGVEGVADGLDAAFLFRTPALCWTKRENIELPMQWCL